MRRQQFLVDARFVIITLQVRGRRELDQVLVANRIPDQQAEMMINVASTAGRFLFASAAGRDINFAADNGFDTLFACRLVKVNDAVHGAVVGDGQRGEFQFMGFVHQPVQTAGAIEQRILGVKMEMNKVRVRHEHNLTFTPEDTKSQS